MVMPLTEKGKKILEALKKEYGDKKGESVFYAMINAGKLKGAEVIGGRRRSVPSLSSAPKAMKHLRHKPITVWGAMGIMPVEVKRGRKK
jgi:hypothetical protein